jgi:hypothetical protein
VQVHTGTLIVGNQIIRSLLDPVVQKFVTVPLSEDELGADGWLEGHVHCLFRFPLNQGQGYDFGGVAQAREAF